MTSWSHFNTDRSRFYFDKEVVVDNGGFSSYDQNLEIRADYNATASDNQLYLKTNGNIGIGTISPSEKLDVNGTMEVTGGIMSGSGSNKIMWKTFTGTTTSQGYNTTVSHGISSGKKRILSVSVNVQCDEDGPSTIPTQAFIAGAGNVQDEITDTRQFQTWYDDTKIYIHIDSESSAMNANRYTMIVIYSSSNLY